MAFVGISKALTEQVGERIRCMHGHEENQNVRPDALDTAKLLDVEQVKAIVWGEHLHMYDMVPEGWCRQCDRLDIKLHGEVLDAAGVSLFKNHEEFHVDLPTRKRFKQVPSAAPRAVTYVALNDDGTLTGLEIVRDWYQTKTQIKYRWFVVREQVLGFLTKCKSLNEALKLWPSVDMYIPMEFLLKARAETTRRAATNLAAEMLATIDTDHAVASAVIARMAGMRV